MVPLRRTSRALGALLVVALPAAAAAQQALEADRPDFTEAASVVGARGVQVEAGYSVEPANDLDKAAPEVLARLGLGRRVEARLGWLEARRASLGAKVRLGGSADRGVALLAGTSFPRDRTAADQHVTPALQLAGSRALGPVALGAMSGITLGGEGEGTRFTQTVVVAAGIAGAVSAFAEYAAGVGGSAPTEHLGHAGMVFGVLPDLQFDLHAAIPLGDAGSGLVGAGLAFRFRVP